MKDLRIAPLQKLTACLLLLALILVACNAQKDTAASRRMQNLTARYNILFNGNEKLNLSRTNIEDAFPDEYDHILSVYKEPNETAAQTELGKLDEVITKANTIINEKGFSNYIDDAYLMIGKANYYKTNFFNAIEFFNYVIEKYPKEHDNRQTAFALKARALMQINEFEQAETAIDSALKNIRTSKRTQADVFASAAQLRIYARKDTAAISLLEKAVKLGPEKNLRLRWTYVLGQLYEENGNKEMAYQSFTRVEKSNAPFELSFNANLSRLRIMASNSDPSNMVKGLLSLVKDDKNRDFIDQIYYQTGNVYLDKKDYKNALKYYNLSVRNSNRNQNQKGLSYLKMADIYFKNLSDHVKAKHYYDSTVTTLSKNHPSYELVVKKANNLQTLVDQMNIIAQQDTLQMLAKLPEGERKARIEKIIAINTPKQAAQVPTTFGNQMPYTGMNNGNPNNGMQGSDNSSNFYFYNQTAISLGFTEFKRRWGNRKLEDNWRRSTKSAADQADVMALNPDPAHPDAAAQFGNKNGASLKADDLIKTYLDELPLDQPALDRSNNKIIEAYFSLGNFYKEVLNDDHEAIETFETLLKRFPDNKHKAAVYYSLFRLYSDKDKTNAEFYRSEILKLYPNSVYAKIILDPDFARKQDEMDVALTKNYNDVFDLYIAKKYPDVIGQTGVAKTTFSNNRLAPQYDYLKALAVGHTQKVGPFLAELKTIVDTYPNDRFIVPLVKRQIDYVEKNPSEFSNRPTALLEFDPSKSLFFLDEPELSEPAPKPEPVAEQPKAVIAKIDTKKDNNKPAVTNKPVVTPPVAPPVTGNRTEQSESSLFSVNDDVTHYFIINVMSPDANLSSSRFGLGQFNRLNYQGKNMKHQVKELDKNQLIYISQFGNRKDAESYKADIIPLLRTIMKVEASKYNIFIITKENFDKITNSQLLEKYIEFYQKNYTN